MATVKATEVKVPAKQTLQRHGLTEDEWRVMLDRQEGHCALCPAGKVPGNGVLYIDHKHVRAYYNLDPEEQKKYHRGLLCFLHNKLSMARGCDKVEVFERGLAYLQAYEERSDAS